MKKRVGAALLCGMLLCVSACRKDPSPVESQAADLPGQQTETVDAKQSSSVKEIQSEDVAEETASAPEQAVTEPGEAAQPEQGDAAEEGNTAAETGEMRREKQKRRNL